MTALGEDTGPTPECALRNLVDLEFKSLSEAKERLGHASESTTRKFYPVKAVRITPLVIEMDWGLAALPEFGNSAVATHSQVIGFKHAPVAQLDRAPGFELVEEFLMAPRDPLPIHLAI